MIENRCDDKDCEILRKTFGKIHCEDCPKYKDIQIKLLGERCNQLLKDKDELLDQNRELERELEEERFITSDLKKEILVLKTQIDRMKCPWTCKKFSNCKLSNCPCDDWEMKLYEYKTESRQVCK